MTEGKIEDNEETIDSFVINKFKSNWAFWLFYEKGINYWLFAVLLPSAIFIIGAIFSALLHVFPVYVADLTLYLNLFGIALAFIAFGWFTHKLPRLLGLLADLFKSHITAYKAKISKWGEFANKNWRMIGIGAVLAIFNLVETIKYWTSPHPPVLLVPWVNSDASTFFAIFYGFLHVIAIPFILGSGMYGMYGIIRLFGDIFKIPIELVYYRRAEFVVSMTGWLLMWALIGLSSIAIFGRPLIFSSTDISWIKTSGLFQSIIATLIVLAVGSIPLIVIGNAIEAAKSKERTYLETKYQEIYKKFWTSLNDKTDDQQQVLSEKLKILDERLHWINGIPTIPIRWPSVLRISFGVVVSVFSPFIQDWLINYLLSLYRN